MLHVPNKYRWRNHPIVPSSDESGNNGCFVIPHSLIKNYVFQCQVSDGMGWEHVSITVHPINQKATRCPTWAEMCCVKELFWDDEDCVVQYHPPKSEYVSMHHFCLHLWRPTNESLPKPDSLMVGINLK